MRTTSVKESLKILYRKDKDAVIEGIIETFRPTGVEGRIVKAAKRYADKSRNTRKSNTSYNQNSSRKLR